MPFQATISSHPLPALYQELSDSRLPAMYGHGERLQLLTKNQRNKDDEMLGEPFDLAKLRTPSAVSQPTESKDKPKDR